MLLLYTYSLVLKLYNKLIYGCLCVKQMHGLGSKIFVQGALDTFEFSLKSKIELYYIIRKSYQLVEFPKQEKNSYLDQASTLSSLSAQLHSVNCSIRSPASGESKLHQISSVIRSAIKEKRAILTKEGALRSQNVPLSPQLTAKLIALKNLNQPDTQKKKQSKNSNDNMYQKP